MKTILKLAAVGSLAALSSCKYSSSDQAGEPAGGTLVITAIPDEKVSDQEANFAALQDYLAEELDIDVEFSISADYPAAVQRFKNGEVHLVWFGGLTGVQAREAVPGARAIAQGDVDPEYVSYFIAHKSTGLSKSESFPGEAIKDLTFTFGSPSSTSGRLMPTYFIQEETGQAPEDFFTQPVQFQTKGSHDATARAVASGSVQVGALSYKKYESMVADGDISAEDAPVIWVTPQYADYNLTVHPDLEDLFGDGFIDKLQTVLVDCDDKEVLKAFNRDDLIPAKNEDFAGIVKVAKELDLLR
ncbi:putative selenate ABC transporter substrate-binding protein [Roseibacillus ishigakijimensis]|uniref:Selenate ABC transporter substrate-binding protein n=1 Tax=Roseibacillus ishigakijimensis TaxID=454146 RepID=A0A934RJP8_9BACT|nr:putative selenate ABC transporter substrate-binding protein [Roseibacillus ishigakijimensis]MBK1832927.1 putative selenate ABC transporter substrate-binding protein [Roseibacillus ishigakijimensis]